MASKYLLSNESGLDFADDLEDSEVSEMGEEDAEIGGFKTKSVSTDDDWLDNADEELEDFIDGKLDASGQNIYVRRDGVISTIHRYDINNDGFSDFAMSYAYQENQYTGDVAIYLGKKSINSDPYIIINGITKNGYLGTGLAISNDINGDSFAEVFVGENATYLPMLQQLCEQRNVIVAEALLDRLPIMNLDKGKLGSYIPAGIATICTLDREIKTTWNIFGFLDDRLDAKRDNFKHTIERLLEVICHRLRITKDELLLYADETQKKVLQKFLPTQEERSPRLTLQDIVVDHYHLFNADDFNELKNNNKELDQFKKVL